MTEQQKEAFLTKFAGTYDLPAAAAKAGIGRREAYALLADPQSRETLDKKICARTGGAVLHRIRQEYEKIAFGEDGEIRAPDRIRALEQLRLIASSDTPEGGAPTVVIRCEYV